MRIRISHETIYRYDAPAYGVIQTLRLTPRNHEGQHVLDWRVDLSEDCPLHQHEDAFGNITHAFTADGPFDELRVLVEGDVDMQDMGGMVRGGVERFPPTLFLRETALTRPDAAISAFAQSVQQKSGDDILKLLHNMVGRLNHDMVFDPDPTHVATTAAESFALGRGVCQDLTHIFITAARALQIPARYVGGYFKRADGVVAQDAGHAWAEAFVPDLGWVAFDATNGISATDAHVRVAVGLDYLGAAPVRGTRYGGGAETLAVAVRVDQAQQQRQN
jgi:transglutaminase-like putative cysteine protease